MVAQVYKDLFKQVNPKTVKSVFTNWSNLNFEFSNLNQFWSEIRNIEYEQEIIFKTVAIYNQQVQRMLRGTGYSFELPALFFEVNEDNYETHGSEITASDMIVNFHIVMQELDSSDGNLDQNLSIFYLRNKVKQWFSLYKVDNGGTFQWLNEDEDYNHNNIYHYITKYKFYYIDKTAERKYYPYKYKYAVWSDIDLNFNEVNELWSRVFINKVYTIWSDEYLTYDNIHKIWSNVFTSNIPLRLVIDVVDEN